MSVSFNVCADRNLAANTNMPSHLRTYLGKPFKKRWVCSDRWLLFGSRFNFHQSRQWKRIQPAFAVVAGWPIADKPDMMLEKQAKYMESTVLHLRKLLGKAVVSKKHQNQASSQVILHEWLTFALHVKFHLHCSGYLRNNLCSRQLWRLAGFVPLSCFTSQTIRGVDNDSCCRQVFYRFSKKTLML